MLQAHQRRRADEGFTLIELMVVVLIISILVAIAIPTFLGARSGAQDRGAQSSLRNGLTAAKTIYADDGSFAGADDTNLPGVEPSLTYQGATVASTGQADLSVRANADDWTASAQSDSGECFYIFESAAEGTFYFSEVKTGGATCNANDAPTAPTRATPGSWSTAGW